LFKEEEDGKIFKFAIHAWVRVQLIFSPIMVYYSYHSSVEPIVVGKPKLALLLGKSEKPTARVLIKLEENTAMTPAPLLGCGYNRNYSERILGAFAKLREETISFRSHWTNFHEMMIFQTSVQKIHLSLNLTRITDDLHEDLCSFITIIRRILLRMKIVSDKFCRDNQNTHFKFSVYEMWKNTSILQTGRSQVTIWRMHIACWIPKATNTRNMQYF
jgi:hypothetical protein